MEISSARWMSEWEMEDATFIDQFQINPLDFSLDELKFEQTGRTAPDFYGSPAQTPMPSAVAERPVTQVKIADSCSTGAHTQIFAPKADSSSSSSHIICFESSNSSQAKSGNVYDVNGTIEPKLEMASESDGNLNFSSLITESWKENQYCSSGYGQGIKRAPSSMNRNPLHARDHVIAERKRREKLSQRFIALSALIPGLNRIDKASILSGAVRYVKELEDRLKVVEEQASKMSVEPAVFVKRSSLSSSDDDTSSSDENSVAGRPVPEIEVRVSNKDVLVRIHCQKRKGCLSYMLNKIEKLNLTIVNSSALPFGHSNLDITIVAQVEVGFCMTVEDAVKSLRQALLEFI